MNADPTEPASAEDETMKTSHSEDGSDWHVLNEGVTYGPYAPEQMIEFAKSGSITSESMVWTEGQQEWIPAGIVAGLLPETHAVRASPKKLNLGGAPSPAIAGRLGVGSGYPNLHPSLSSNPKAPPVAKILALIFYMVFGVVPLIVGLFIRNNIGEVYSLGIEQSHGLNFMSGIDGKWKGEGLSVKEFPVTLKDGTVIDWKFDSVRTNDATWLDQIYAKDSKAKSPGNGWIKFVLPNDGRLVGNHLEFRVEMKVTAARRFDKSHFENVTFNHSQMCGIKVGNPSEIRTREWAASLATFGIIVTLLGALIFLQIAKSKIRS